MFYNVYQESTKAVPFAPLPSYRFFLIFSSKVCSADHASKPSRPRPSILSGSSLCVFLLPWLSFPLLPLRPPPVLLWQLFPSALHKQIRYLPFHRIFLCHPPAIFIAAHPIHDIQIGFPKEQFAALILQWQQGAGDSAMIFMVMVLPVPPAPAIRP